MTDPSLYTKQSRTNQFFLSGRFLDEQFSETDTDIVTVVGPRADMLRTRAKTVFAKPLAHKRPMAAWNPTLYATQNPHTPQCVEISSPLQANTT